MTRKCIALLMLPLSLAACGRYGALETPEGQALPPLAYGQDGGTGKDAKTGQGAEELTAPSAQARPGRSVELLSRSERRGQDPFDLAPGSQPETQASSDEKDSVDAKDPVDAKAPPESSQHKN